jgi:hypothetical protein
MHIKYVDKIVEKGNKESMEMLDHVFDKAMEHIEECDEELYHKLCNKLYVALNGKILTEEKAKEIVKNMKPYSTHWTLEETKQVQSKYGMTNIRDIDFFVVMNSAYNDYKDLFDTDVEMYAKFSKNFIDDKDAKKDKVFIYYMNIPERD